MKYIKFSGNAGYSGTSFEHYEKFEDADILLENGDYDAEYLDSYLEELVDNNSWDFEYLATRHIYKDDYSTLEEFEEELEQAKEDYYSSLSGEWEEVTYEEYMECNF